MMKKLIIMLLTAILTLSLLAACGDSNNTNEDSNKITAFSVGYAKVDITPMDPVPLAGFGDNNERISNGVLDPLYATCIAFSDVEGNTVLLYSLDLLNTSEALVKDIREKVNVETGIPVINIHLTASHTHSGYDTDSSANGAVAKANLQLVERSVEAAKTALADRKPAQMYGSFSRPDNLNYVRHYVLSDATYQGYKLGTLPRDQIYGHIWKADNLLQIIKFTREGGKDIVLVNWQSHYYGTKNENYYGLSADYPGALRDELEAKLDCQAAFVLGGGGNINCTSQIGSENHNKGYKEHGKMLAAAAIESMNEMQILQTGSIHLKQKAFVAPGTIKENEITAFGFGDFGIVFAPWEIFDVHAKGVRDDSNYTYTYYASCANGGWGNRYLAHDASFDYYSYEASTAKYPRGTAELLQAELTELINTCFQESGQAQKERAEGYTSVPFEPVSDGLVYTNPKPGDMSAFLPVKSGYYSVYLMEGTNVKQLLILNEEVAKQVSECASTKLLFDDRGIVVGVQEP